MDSFIGRWSESRATSVDQATLGSRDGLARLMSGELEQFVATRVGWFSFKMPNFEFSICSIKAKPLKSSVMPENQDWW